MAHDHGFFTPKDYKITHLAGMDFPAGWWSRGYEYAWAMKYAEPDEVVADMGCGYTYRPFKDGLAQVCKKVYAVDGREELLTQAFPKNCIPLVAMLNDTPFEEGELDKIFCISVLEEISGDLAPILREFYRVLKPGGVAICTFDVPRHKDKPLGIYKGLNLPHFYRMCDAIGFDFGQVDFVPPADAVTHEEYNLCVFHTTLKKL